MLFRKDELKELWPFYLDAFLPALLFFAPAFFVIYFLDIGLSTFQIGLLLAMSPLTALIFEIPTGAIADIYGRKFSTLLGFFLEGIGFLLAYFFDSFYELLGIFFILGIAATLSSGASDAWKVDLINKKNKKWLKGYFLKFESLYSLGLVFSGILGTFVVKRFGLSSIWLVGAFSFFITLIILSFGEEYYKKQKMKIRESYKILIHQTKKSFDFSFKHHILFYLLLAVFVFLIAESFNASLTWTPLLSNLGFPDYAFGYLWSFIALIGVFAPIISNKLLKENKEKNFLVLFTFLFAIASISTIFVGSIVSAFVVLFFIHLFINMRYPVTKIYFQKFLPTKMRATIGSIEGMIICVAGIISPILIGYSIGLIGAKYTIFTGGIIALIVVLLYLRINEGKEIKN